MWAVKVGNKEMIELLLQHSADVDKVDKVSDNEFMKAPKLIKISRIHI
jgi:ankyrin repeat protein